MDVVAVVLATDREVVPDARMPEARLSPSGDSLVLRAVRGVLDVGCVRHVVVVAPVQAVDVLRGEPELRDAAVQLVPAAADRASSIWRGLGEAIGNIADGGAVLLHDAARAFTPAALIAAVVRELEKGAPVVIPALPVTDTVKRVDATGDISGTVDRARLRVVQTPQGFAADVLRSAIERIRDVPCEEGELVDRIGKPVTIVPGHASALRVRTAFDWAVARTILTTEAAIGNDQR